MKPLISIGFRRFMRPLRRLVQAFRGLMPGYGQALGSRVGASKHSYGGQSKPILRVLLGIVVAAVVVCVCTWWFVPGAHREAYLRDELHLAMKKADYDKAHRLVTNLLALSPEDADYLWWSASVDEKRHQPEKAYAIRTRLAHRSYGPAVLWLADHDYHLETITSWSDQHHSDFLALLTENSPWLPDIKCEIYRRLAAYWTIRGDFENAAESLSHICQWKPAEYVNIASLYLKLGDLSRAETNANLARVALQSRIDREPNDPEARLQLVRALIILQREKEAMASLADGFALTRQPAMQQAAGEVLVSWARRLARTDGSEATHWQRLQMIHRATQCAPQDGAVLAATAELIREFQVDEASRMVELREASAIGMERTAAHWMLGWLYAFRSQEQRAIQHLRVALVNSPEIPTLANNLAIHLQDRSGTWSERELTLANIAIQLLPDQPHFSETRGRALMGNQRWHEAIVDLQKALTVEALQPRVYQQLTQAYREVGNLEAAIRYENLHKSVVESK